MSKSVNGTKDKSSAELASSAELPAQHKSLAEANDNSRNPKLAWLDVFVTNATSAVSGFSPRTAVEQQHSNCNINLGVLFGKVCFEDNLDFTTFSHRCLSALELPPGLSHKLKVWQPWSEDCFTLAQGEFKSWRDWHFQHSKSVIVTKPNVSVNSVYVSVDYEECAR